MFLLDKQFYTIYVSQLEYSHERITDNYIKSRYMYNFRWLVISENLEVKFISSILSLPNFVYILSNSDRRWTKMTTSVFLNENDFSNSRSSRCRSFKSLYNVNFYPIHVMSKIKILFSLLFGDFYIL